MLLIIDRFEGDWAIIECEHGTFTLPKSLLPEGAKEGDVIELSVSVDEKATVQQRRKARSLLDYFFDE